MLNTEKPRLLETEQIDQLKSLRGDSPLRTLKVPVTADDCKNGKPGHPTSCAIALAVRHLFPEASFVCVRLDGLTVTSAGRYLHFAPNRTSSRFIEEFDTKGNPEPRTFSYVLKDARQVAPISPKRKAQINAARDRRKAEGRPDKTYKPQRMRMADYGRDEVRAAIEKAKHDAEGAN